MTRMEAMARRLMGTAAATVMAAALTAGASEVPPAVDGLFEDWSDVPPAFTDTTGDGARLDLGRVWVRSNADRVTFSFETGLEINLQSGNELTLLIDGDGDKTTGNQVEGIGADLVWRFGDRKGEFWTDAGKASVEQSEVGLLQAPTVSSERFEVSFVRWSPDLGDVIPGPDIAFVLKDDETTWADRLPDAGSVRAELSLDPPPTGGEVDLGRRDPDDIRVLTYNVLFDGLFKRPAPFIRILRAIDPDVICFQEIWSHTAQQAADQVSLALPDATWYGANTTEGHVVSRYPFLEDAAIDEAGNYWALIDLPDDRYGVDLSVVSAHPPCCEKEKERQEQLDGIAAWLRDLEGASAGGADAARASGEPWLPSHTPIVIAGDMNLVGGAVQVRTLVNGEIVYVDEYGPPHPADWDGTPMMDSDPRQAGGIENYTWRDARSSFAPGRLDYIVYSDSVLRPGNSFVLATETLSDEALSRYGLRASDTLESSDHLPVVADFTPVAAPARTGTGE